MFKFLLQVAIAKNAVGVGHKCGRYTKHLQIAKGQLYFLLGHFYFILKKEINTKGGGMY